MVARSILRWALLENGLFRARQLFENSAFRSFRLTRYVFVGVIAEINSVALSGFSGSALVFSPNPSFKRTPNGTA